MALLTQQELINTADALVLGGIDSSVRNILFQFIDPRYKAVLAFGLAPSSQIIADIGHMNQVERLANGDIPLQLYLTNAVPLLAGAPKEQGFIRQILDLISQRVSGAPRINVVNVPETKELIIHADDTVPFRFMERGLTAARSVVKLQVAAFENGQAKRQQNGTAIIANGTGWLISPTLLMTNHHVINARKEGEPDAANADLLLQGKNVTVILDFDEKDTTGTEIKSLSLEAWHKDLDYAILRIPDTSRAALQTAASKITFTNEPIPVNIIQHPNGHAKRFAIRNNLVSASTDTDLRYFTDTEGGSSGSPVFNDKWEVVALHRGSLYVENVHFQGKQTAYINVGTHLQSILNDICTNFAALAAEIRI